MAAKSSDAQVPEDDDLESSEENGKIYEITDALSCSGSQQSITHSNEVNASLNVGKFFLSIGKFLPCNDHVGFCFRCLLPVFFYFCDS